MKYKRGPGRPRTKNTPKAVRPFTKTDLAIEDRLAAAGRGERDHIIYLGEVVERVILGNPEFTAILKALTAGRSALELRSTDAIPAERKLGRLEMATFIYEDLEQFVLDKDALLQPLKEETVEDEFLATEPAPQR